MLRAICCLSLFLLIVPVPVMAAEPPQTAAQKQLALFLDGERGGNACTRDNGELVMLNPKLRAKVDKELSVACLYLTVDDMHVVSGYEIKEVKVNGEKGEAQVEFAELAVLKGEGTERELTGRGEKIVVNYQLRKTKGKWVVYDPPAMRIGLPAMTDFYGMAIMGKDIRTANGTPPTEEEKILLVNKTIYAGLKALAP